MEEERKTSDRVFYSWEGSVIGWTKPHDPKPKDKIWDPAVATLMRRPRSKFLEPSTMEDRKRSITATDVSSVVSRVPTLRGTNKYRSWTRLLQDKTFGRKEPGFMKPLEHGNFYEPEALRVYEMVTGNEVMPLHIGWCKGPPEGRIDYHVPDIVGATPDSVCMFKPVLIEVKCPFFKTDLHEYEVPDLYWPQIQTQMAVTGIHTLHFVRYVPPTDSFHGSISIREVLFDPVWWREAVPHIYATWGLIERARLGIFEIKKPQPPAKRQRRCRIISTESSSKVPPETTRKIPSPTTSKSDSQTVSKESTK